MIILFIAGGIPAAFMRWWMDTHMTDTEKEDEDEDGE
jgi:fluoride ion exporter CrcB/FEX